MGFRSKQSEIAIDFPLADRAMILLPFTIFETRELVVDRPQGTLNYGIAGQFGQGFVKALRQDAYAAFFDLFGGEVIHVLAYVGFARINLIVYAIHSGSDERRQGQVGIASR